MAIMRLPRWLVTLAILAGCGPGPEPDLRIPAEWEEHEAVWLSWVDDSDENNLVLAAIIRELQGSVKVKVVFSSEPARRRSFLTLDDLAVDTQAMEAHVFPGADTWIRDQGAVFATDGPGRLTALDLGWSQYGQVDWSYARWPEWFEGRYDSVKTSVERSPGSRVDSLMGAAVKARHHKVNVILEGGSFEYNGQGVLIQSEAVTLQRNPGRTRQELETEFRRLGIEKVIWLPQGVVEDEHFQVLIDNEYLVGGSGGHTDEFVRFADEHTILLAWVDEDELDDHPLDRINRERMSRNLEILERATDLNGDPFRIIKMPIPRPIETKLEVVDDPELEGDKDNVISIHALPPGHQLAVGDTIKAVAAAGYLNFLVTNGLVLTAGYAEYGSGDKDEEARSTLQQAFPGRHIVMLDATPLNGRFGGGGIHCATLQEPKVK